MIHRSNRPEDIRIQGRPPEGPPASSLFQPPSDPVTLVLFGASGELTQRKIIPALYRLYREKALPRLFTILGAARTDMDTQLWRKRLKLAIQSFSGLPLSAWPEFEKNLFYTSAAYDEVASFERLGAELDRLDAQRGTKGNRLFYLAVPRKVAGSLVRSLGAAGLAREDTTARGWARVVVEKPYGLDSASSADDCRELAQVFNENQVFRIGHFIARATMQNLMVFRMANALVEAAWNRNFIQEVCILAAESQGVEHRGRYYDENGVLRDTFMNSLLKILAISAMEPPSSLDGEAVRDETAKVIRAIQPLNPANVNDQLVLGQYQSGWVRGAPVPGYRKEPGVARGSITPTYAALKTFIDNERWRGVPFYLVTGKRLPTRETRVVVRFRETSHGTMFQTSVPGVPPNTLVLSLQPEEKALVTIQIRTPGANLGLRPLQMEFGFLDGYEGPELEPYEWGLLDVMAGDPLMFWRRDGLEAAWAFISPILEAATPGAGTVVHEYDAGTWGPADTSRLVPHLAWSDD